MTSHGTTLFAITPALTEADMRDVAMLFRDYVAALGVDLGYQNFDEELAGLPGKYAPPEGALLLARDRAGQAIGCAALRPLQQGRCELKRLYVAPQARGLGLGRALMEHIIERAQHLGYEEMCLDTLPRLTEAMALYMRYGFRVIDPYYDSPIIRPIFMGRPLILKSGAA